MMKEVKKIVFIHLLNDFSGSPRILSQVINSAIDENFEADIFTCKNDSEGFLSNLKGTNSYHFFYKWSPFKLVTLVLFLFSQFILFFKLLRYRKENVIFYINTVLPFGAALAGKIMNKKVIYHIHETSIKPAIFKNFLFSIARNTAEEAIYVSHFLLETEQLKGVNCNVVHNALTNEFINISNSYKPNLKQHFTVLMLSSLKEYKGVVEFVELANNLNKINFELVINATQKEIDLYFKKLTLPTNLIIFPSQSNVHPFYQRAHLVLNLSHPLKWVETFGMTALEAMSYSIPVIVPPVGGIAELVDKGGYKIDVRNQEEMKNKILSLSTDNQKYMQYSENAKANSTQFNPQTMAKSIFSIVKKQR